MAEARQRFVRSAGRRRHVPSSYSAVEAGAQSTAYSGFNDRQCTNVPKVGIYQPVSAVYHRCRQKLDLGGAE